MKKPSLSNEPKTSSVLICKNRNLLSFISLKEINDILDQFNSQKSNRKSIINNKIEPIINDYITNYNIILELLRNENLIKSKKDTI